MPAMTAGAEMLVNTTTSGDQQYPQIARLNDGGFVVVWQDNSGTGGDGSGYSVRAQRYDTNGAKIGSEFLVNQNSAGDQYEPKVAGLASGGFVIVWTDNTGDANGAGVKARIYGPSGSPVGGEFLMNTDVNDQQWQPVPEALPGGGFVVTWAHRSGDSSLYAVKGQIFDSGGAKVGAEFRANTTQYLYQDNGKVTALAGGGFVVVWNDFSHLGGDSSGYSVKGQLFDASGNKVGAEFLVNTNTAFDQGVGNRSVSALSSGGFVVAWASNDPAADGSGYAVKAQIFDASGAKLGGEFLVNTNTAGDQFEPVTLALSGGGFLIAWTDGTGDGSAQSVKGQMFDASGAKVDGEFLINSITSGDQLSPMLAAFGSGFAAVWGDNSGVGGDASGFGVKLRLFSLGNVINGTEDNDDLVGTDGDDIINGLGGDDHLAGFAGNDVLNGGDGLDFLSGGPGTDTYDGGAGDFDQVQFDDPFATQGVVADLRNGIVSNDGFGNVETMTNVECLGGGTRFPDTFYGNNGVNGLQPGTGDYAYGFGGDDFFNIEGAPALIHGGSGSDAVNAFRQARLVDNNGDGLAEWEFTTNGVFIDLLQGMIFDDGFGGSGVLVSIENVIGSAGNDRLYGSDFDNFLVGSGGDDLIDGRGGNDLILGGDGGDYIFGGVGDDMIDGGAGIDTASFQDASGSVTVNLTTGVASGAAGNDSIISIEYLVGSNFTDLLIGDGGNNSLLGVDGDDVLEGRGGHDALSGHRGNDVLLGGDGDDFLVGGAGDDVIDGGAGFDRAGFFQGAMAGVHVDLNIQGIAQDTGQGMDTLISIEHLSGTRFNDVLIGNSNDNWIRSGFDGESDTISGNGGNDLIEVGAGTHILSGGAGIDTWSLIGNTTAITSAGVTLSLALQGAAQNTGQGMMTATGIENLSGSIYGDRLTGDGADNVIAGDEGSDVLNGGDGNDVLYGDGRIWVDLQGKLGSGQITTWSELLDVFGSGAGNDVLNGGKGNDTLVGGEGDDVLTGGQGIDGFVFGAGSGHDRITDLDKKEVIAFRDVPGVDDISDLLITEVGKDTVISWGGGLASITLENFKAKHLSADNFDFGVPLVPATLAAASFGLLQGDAQFLGGADLAMV